MGMNNDGARAWWAKHETILEVGHDTLPVVTISKVRRGGDVDPWFLLVGAEILTDDRNGITRIVCKSATATDEEHDRIHLVDLDIAGFAFSDSGWNRNLYFRGVLMGGAWHKIGTSPETHPELHDGEMCDDKRCTEPHMERLPYTPNECVFPAIEVEILVGFPLPEDRAKLAETARSMP